MLSGVSERLADLAAVATRLRALIDGELPGSMLPGLAVCRVAVVADGAASKLAGFLDSLVAAAQPASMAQVASLGQKTQQPRPK